MQELGADEVVDYQTEDFAEKYKDKPFDLILDPVGGALSALQAHTVTSKTFNLIIVIKRFSCQSRQGAAADKLQVKAVKVLPLVGHARSKQDPINRGHGAQH